MSKSKPATDRNARFAGRRIYITGAASGIGRATAGILAQGGAALALVDVNEEGLKEAAAETGGHPLAVDLTDGAAIDRSVKEAAEKFGGIDGIVNCAGVASGGGIENLDPEEWDRVIAINLTAPYRICRAAMPYLRKEQDVSIVNVSSGAAILPTGPGASAYAASKGGLLSFTKGLAAEIGPEMRANVVCPGVVDTPMTQAALHLSDPAAAEAFVSKYTLHRAADPSELGEAIAFLMSSEASFITGIVLSVDGGRTFH